MTLIAVLLLPLALAIWPFWRESRRAAPLANEAPGTLVKLSQGITHYRWLGPSRGPVVVAIHGLTTPSEVWGEIAADLGAMGFRTLVYDLHGRGYSQSVDGPQDRAHFLAQLGDLLEHLGLEDDLTLMGYSMGGSIATGFAAENLHRVRRLILIAPAGIAQVESGFLDFVRRVPVIGDWLHLLVAPLRAAHQIRSAAEGQVPGLKDVQLAQTKRRGFFKAVLASRRGMLSEVLEAEHRAVARHAIPVLAVWGGADRVIPITALGRLAQWNRGARQEVIEDADHGLPFTHGDQVADFVREVLRELV